MAEVAVKTAETTTTTTETLDEQVSATDQLAPTEQSPCCKYAPHKSKTREWFAHQWIELNKPKPEPEKVPDKDKFTAVHLLSLLFILAIMAMGWLMFSSYVSSSAEIEQLKQQVQTLERDKAQLAAKAEQLQEQYDRDMAAKEETIDSLSDLLSQRDAVINQMSALNRDAFRAVIESYIRERNRPRLRSRNEIP